MRKELLLAILGGILIGVILGFGVWRTNAALKKKANENPVTPKPNATLAPQQPNEFKITLVKPDDDFVATETPTSFSGATEPGSILVISSESKDYVLQVKSDGSFEQNVDLVGGLNQIIMSAFEPSGQKIEQKLAVIYSKEFTSSLPDQSPNTTPTATDSDSIRAKVVQKIDLVRKNPKAYLGVLTDRTDETLQLKNAQGEIQLVSVNPQQTSFVKVATTNSNLTFNDLALGDYIIAMGFTGSNQVLTSSRILVTAAPEEPNRNTVFGTLTAIGKKDVTLKSANGSEVTVTFPKRWDGPEIKQLNEDDNAVVVFSKNSGTNTLRTIAVIPS